MRARRRRRKREETIIALSRMVEAPPGEDAVHARTQFTLDDCADEEPVAMLLFIRVVERLRRAVCSGL